MKEALILLGGNRGTDREKGDIFAKSTCFVEGQFGERIGIDIVENNEWFASFRLQSEAAAKRVLHAENVPAESIKWAKRILNI